MRKSKFSEEQIIAILAESDAGAQTSELCRRHGISANTFYRWQKKYGGMDVSEARRPEDPGRIRDAAYGISECRAVRFTGFPRSTMCYKSLIDPQEELRTRIRQLAAQRPRWGYRQIHTLLQREGWQVNRKRVQRLYREEGLAVRRKGKRRRSQAPQPGAAADP